MGDAPLSGQDRFEETPGRAAACTNLVHLHAAAPAKDEMVVLL